MDLKVNNQVVLIAGASRGIGRMIAAEFLAEGARVVLTGRNESDLLRTHAELETLANRGRIHSVAGDLLNQDLVNKVVASAIAEFGVIDHLVSNIGTGKGERGWQLADAEWRRLFEINFFGPARITQAVLPHLLANPKGGSIVYIASIVGLEATPAPLPYSAAKAALLNYAKNLSREVAAQRVRVNSLAPGNIFFEGGSWHDRMTSAPDQVMRMLETEVPQRRFGTPEEIAKLAVFLSSPASGFTTGSCVVADGGQTRRF